MKSKFYGQSIILLGTALEGPTCVVQLGPRKTVTNSQSYVAGAFLLIFYVNLADNTLTLVRVIVAGNPISTAEYSIELVDNVKTKTKTKAFFGILLVST